MTKQLSIKFLQECFVCDPVAGTLHWRERPVSHFPDARAAAIFNSRFARTEAGHTDAIGYRRIFITIKGRCSPYMAHRIIWAMVTGSWPENHIDHADKTPTNNRFLNLREATNAENMRNGGLRRDNRLGLKGVRERCGKYSAQIMVDGKSFHLGTYPTAQEASAAYLEAARKHFGEFARAA